MVARLPFGWGCLVAITGEFAPGLLWGQEDHGQTLPPSGAESKHTVLVSERTHRLPSMAGTRPQPSLF